MKTEWSHRALQDMQSIFSYIAEDNSQAAQRVIQKIKHAVRSLPSHPALGRYGRVANTRELVVSATPYIVAYKVIDHKIFIIRIIHAAREWPEKF